MSKKKNTVRNNKREKGGKMKVDKFLSYLVVFLVGAAIATIVAACVVASVPAKKQPCKDGHSTQIENGVKYETYIPALDECSK